MKIRLLLGVLLIPVIGWAQELQKVCGEYKYYMPENVSLSEAKRKVLEEAKIAALAEAFGVRVAQTDILITKDENGKVEGNLMSLGENEVKGEWIQDIGEPLYHIYYDTEKQAQVVEVSICGMAREIISAGVVYSAKVLRNGTELKFESDRFRDGDSFYLFFQSPVKGYLAVYLIDDVQHVFCLLPYMRDMEGHVKIKGNKEYVFFSKLHADGRAASVVDEYIFTCAKEMEHNQLYVIFSPHEFYKANDKQSGLPALPRELSYEDFQKWLVKNRNIDPDMKVEILNVTIEK